MANEEVKIRNVELALRTATDLFLTYGIEGTTKEMISKASALSIRSVDRYFANKADCVTRSAQWISQHVWQQINDRYPKTIFAEGKQTGLKLLEQYMNDLKGIFMEQPRLFVFYSDFKIYFSRHSDNYLEDYTRMLDTIGCRRLSERIYQLGIDDGSMNSQINPPEEAEYFCRAYFAFLSNMAIAYDYQPQQAAYQVDRYIQRVVALYQNEKEASPG